MRWRPRCSIATYAVRRAIGRIFFRRMPELLSNIPRNLAWEVQTVASQHLVCDQVKSVKDVAVNPEATVSQMLLGIVTIRV